MENKESKVKNYVILALIIIFAVVLTIYIIFWYRNYNDTKLNEPVISSSLHEVKYNELDEILKERNFLLMYTCTCNEKKCRNFEKKFSSYVADENLNSDMVYLNLGYDTVEDDLINKLYNKYKDDNLVKKIYNYPSIIVFYNGKIVDVLSSTKNKTITMADVSEFLEGYDL